jgi:hypothetical protein
MATWWELTFTGEPTEADFRHVAEMAGQGFTSGELVNDAADETEEGPATGVYAWGKDITPGAQVTNRGRDAPGQPAITGHVVRVDRDVALIRGKHGETYRYVNLLRVISESDG